ncbi:uncharacterized protein LOC127726662 isoform X2 [Mytilus californianus]|uniref:uncharacterized protein LOC127726662 isoform X2 n=1 Tax=Mytilus californianus TaxID=6549 RepID=UPI0022462BA8|nr:uncharacterized protein LOC127726662 isoform X2 [Mytilus californianus]
MDSVTDCNKEDNMGNYMSIHMYEPVVESDIPSLGHTLVCETPGSDMQPSMENTTDNILEQLPKVSGNTSKKSDWNSGCKERNDVSASLMQMKCLDEQNMPYLEKDVGVHQGEIKFDPIAIKVCFLNEILSYPEHRVGCQKGLLLQNHQAVDNYRKNIQDKQQQSNISEKEAIRKRVEQSRVRKIIDLDDDMDDPLKTSCNTERNFQASSGTHHNNELERLDKMPCGVAYRMKY